MAARGHGNKETLQSIRGWNDAEWDAIVAEFAAGRLVPPVDGVWDLADGREAFERLASGRQFGKVVLRIGDG